MNQEEYLRSLTRSNMQYFITMTYIHKNSRNEIKIKYTDANVALDEYLLIDNTGVYDVILEVEFPYLPLARSLVYGDVRRMLDEFSDNKKDAVKLFGKETILNVEMYRNEILENEEFPVQCAIAKLRGVGSPCIDPAWLGTNMKAVDICRLCMENSFKWLFSYAEGE